MNCPICTHPTSPFASATVLGRHTADYRKCGTCGFTFIASPTWLDEAYQSAINRTDLGQVIRLEQNSRVTKTLLELALNPAGRFLDYGAGYGLLVRRMRDSGYDYWGHDAYCESLFAQDFQIALTSGEKFDLITCFEVFEHLTDPIQVFERIFAHSDALLLTTVLMPSTQPKPGEWWYYGLDHGQHVAFFTETALASVARRFSKHLVSGGGEYHFFSSRPIQAWKFRCAASKRFSRWFDALRQRPSLLGQDFQIAHAHQIKQLPTIDHSQQP
jgi:hypothetical protein